MSLLSCAAAADLILASGSPRRRDLLTAAGLRVRVRPPRGPEIWPGGEASAAVLALARTKLQSVQAGADLHLAADTVVLLDEEPLGKPADRAAAAVTLGRLAGRWHRVLTGFIVARGSRQVAHCITTHVRLRRLRPAEIDAYVATGESLDKAGAYGIQGLGGALVDRLDGSYTNVVGLPLAEVLVALHSLAA